MSTDLLRTQPNERVDHTDFSFMLDESLTGIMRDAGNNFLLDPDGAAADRMRIVEGFALSRVGKQLTVTRGRAFLAERIAGTVHYGMLTGQGEALQTIDMTALASNTYNVYVRFEFVDGESASRVFWNPSGGGQEFTQNIATRRQANWSIRVELASPGDEWLLIGTANNAGAELVLTDLRNLYFEGPTDSSYESGWSTDGGGGANDRSSDRVTHGVTDMQTFTGAMRQCLEDIKGRGLRRWWERDIGGLNVGFDADPTEDTVAIGDANFSLNLGGAVDPTINFDTGFDRMVYSRGADQLSMQFGGAQEFLFQAAGLTIRRGLYVGNQSNTPTDNDVYAEGDLLCGGGVNAGGSVNPLVGDGIFTRGLRVGSDEAPTDDDIRVAGDGYFGGGINVGGAVDPGAGHGVFTGGLVVGFNGSPTADQVRIGDNSFILAFSGSNPLIEFDAADDDYLFYDRTGDTYNFKIADNTELILGDDGLRIGKGLYVGSTGTAPFDNDIRLEGGVNAGGSVNPEAGDGIFTRGLRVGSDVAPTDGDIRCTADAFVGGGINVGGSIDPLIGDGVFTRGIYVGADSAPIEDEIRASGAIRAGTGLYAAAGVNSGGAVPPGVGHGVFTGGLIVGYDGYPTNNAIRIGDSDFIIILGPDGPIFTLDTDGGTDRFSYSRTDDAFVFSIAGETEAAVYADGLRVNNGLYVGGTGTAATDGDIKCTNNVYAAGAVSAGGSVDPGTGHGVFTGGLHVGFDGFPSANQIRINNSGFAIQWTGTNPQILMDTTDGFDAFYYSRANDAFTFMIDSVVEAAVYQDGLRVDKGLSVGDATVAAYDDDIRLTGGIVAGGSTNPTSGDGIFTRGLVVGFDGLPASGDRIEIGSTTMYLHGSASASILRLDNTGGNSGIELDRDNDELDFQLLGTVEMRMKAGGLAIANGLYVGTTGGAPLDDCVTADASFYAGTSYRFLGSNDFVSNVGNTSLDFTVNSLQEMRLHNTGLAVGKGVYVGSTSGTPVNNNIYAEGNVGCAGGINAGGSQLPAAGDGIFTGGLVVGYDAVPTPGQVRIGDLSFRLRWDGTNPYIYFDTVGGSDYLVYNRSVDTLSFVVGGAAQSILSADGISVGKGIFVGSVGVTPYDNDLRVEGGVIAGGTTNPILGQGIFTAGLVVGFDAAPGEDQVQVGDADFSMTYDSNQPRIRFKKDGSLLSQIVFDRTAEYYNFEIDNTDRMRLYPTGLRVQNGLYVGQVAIVPTDDEIRCDGDLHVGGREIYFGIASNDYIVYDDTANTFTFYIDGSPEYLLGAASLDLNSNNIIDAGTVACGAITSTGIIQGTRFQQDAGDYLDWVTDTYATIAVNTVEELRIGTAGLNVLDGIYIGDLTTTPTSAAICVGNTNFRMDWGAGTPRLYWGESNSYFEYSPPNDWLNINIAGTPEGRWTQLGLAIQNGLYVGSSSSAPTDNEIKADGDINSGLDFRSTKTVTIPFNYTNFTPQDSTSPGYNFFHDSAWEWLKFRDTGGPSFAQASLHVPAKGTIGDVVVRLQYPLTGQDYRVRVLKKSITDANPTQIAVQSGTSTGSSEFNVTATPSPASLGQYNEDDNIYVIVENESQTQYLALYMGTVEVTCDIVTYGKA